SKRRTWVKLHIGVDEASGEIMASTVTTKNIVDKEILPDLLAQLSVPIRQISADSGYDYLSVYQQADQYHARAIIPPKSKASIHPFDKRWQQRDNNRKRIVQIGMRKWKKESAYHRRSLAETTFFRLKTIFGDRIYEKNFNNQATELLFRCLALNKMTALGMP